MTCLYVVMLGISQCLQAPPPVDAVCHPVGDGVQYCTVEELPAWASYYNPEFCLDKDWDPNCFYDDNGEPTWEYLGDGTPTSEGYGRYMACPYGLYGKTFTFESAGTWQCRDHGGSVQINHGRRYTPEGFVTGWEVIFDFLLLEPEWWTYNHLDILEVE